MTLSQRFAAACLALVLCAGAGACGRKTAPLVPDSPRPEAVKDIKAVARDTVAYLSWPIPAKNVEGKAVSATDIDRFRIERAEVGPDRKRARYKPYAEIDMANPSPSVVRDGEVAWSDARLRYGQVYSYRIRAFSVRGGVSAWSDEVRIAPLLSLAVPKGFAAQFGDSSVLLSWETVSTRMDGSQYEGFVGYNLYRGTETGRYEAMPLNKEPLRTTAYKDTAVGNNRTYYYILRSVDSPALPWKESLDSAEVSAIPRDLTPPERPTGLTVVPGVNRVFLTWNENTERDLAGYHIYRATKSAKDYERLTERPLNRTTFSDETVKGGSHYTYAITAVDQAGNESKRSEEKKAYVEKLK